MALVPLATKGNYFHVYDYRVKAGRGDEFVELFNKFDYGQRGVSCETDFLDQGGLRWSCQAS